MIKTYEYRLYPTKKQEELLTKHFGCTRLVYNKALDLKKKLWEESKKSISCYELCHKLTEWKQTEEFSFLREVANCSLQQAIRHLEKSYKSFFKGGGYPKFKSKKSKQSFTLSQKSYLYPEKGLIKVLKFPEGIKVKIDRTFKGTIKTCTIKKTITGKYFISINVEDGKELPQKHKVNSETTVGIDLGIKTLATISNGQTIENMRFFKNSEERLKILQRRVSKKVKGSNRQKKAYLKAALLHEKIKNQRKDYIHKFTSKLVHDNQVDTICLEDLNVKGMIKNRRLAKSISDTIFSEIKRQLEYKCLWNSKNLLYVDRFYPSSKTCSNCGYIKEDLTLNDRDWSCPICGVKHNRDFNASVNIKREALKNYFSRQGMPVELVESSSVEEATKRELSYPKGK